MTTQLVCEPVSASCRSSPLRVMFILTSMPVGGAETLLVNLIRQMDRDRFWPEICCVKEAGPLGELLAREVPVHSRLLHHKYDARVLGRLTHLFRGRQIDAVITVGAGDKMFWGRLAAWRAGVPVVASALHSTGWPDGMGRLNRCLTTMTDAFIAVANAHGQFLVDVERLPQEKVVVIPNGVDTRRFQPCPAERMRVRRALSLTDQTPLCGIVAALRPEKNHRLYLRAARLVLQHIPTAHFLIIGDGPLRAELEQEARTCGIRPHVHFLGTRQDIPQLVAALDVLALTSDNEANPVSLLEGMAAGIPVVATRVGSVAEMVHHEQHGLLVAAGDTEGMAVALQQILTQPTWGRALGQAARLHVIDHGSLQQMVEGYQRLILGIYNSKRRVVGRR